MADLVELKRTDDEKKRDGYSGDDIKYAPDYPWGLTLRLGPDEMKKLGIGSMAAGVDVMVTARCRVSEVGSSEVNGEVRNSASLQVEAMSVDTGVKPSDGEVLYGGAK